MLRQLAGRRYRRRARRLRAGVLLHAGPALPARGRAPDLRRELSRLSLAHAAAAVPGLRHVPALSAAALGAGADAGVRGRSGRRRCSARAWCNTSSGRRAALPIRPPTSSFSPASCCWSAAHGRRARAIASRAAVRRRPAVRARAVRAAEHRAGGGRSARRRRPRGAVAAPVSARRRPVHRLPAGARHGAAQLGLRRRVRAVHRNRRASRSCWRCRRRPISPRSANSCISISPASM